MEKLPANEAYVAQLFWDGKPNQTKGYQELRHARTRATLYMKEGERYHRNRHGVKIFKADFRTLTLTQVDERGNVTPKEPAPGDPTLF